MTINDRNKFSYLSPINNTTRLFSIDEEDDNNI